MVTEKRARATQDAREHALPSPEDMRRLFIQKYGAPGTTGWAARRRFRYGYYLPADVYEAVVSRFVVDGCSWLDVGGGHSVFPENQDLARTLISRCEQVVAVDPSENVVDNRLVHQRVKCAIEDYKPDRNFAVATLRMVAEHIEYPDRVLDALRRLLCPGGVVIVLTVNHWAPISLLARLTPFRLHHPLKRLFWGGDERDTFPIRYKMNSRRRLRRLFECYGFRECAFAYLDDLSAFGNFRYMNSVELTLWRMCRALGIRYPENCLLGVYANGAGLHEQGCHHGTSVETG
jgi:2-polyprenyl-3-methyl-5-hydroxy-6-metoxy-1,4-benzoquinol methylase